ncbi:MAG: hypothetical protein NTZ05_15470 [Chloroflexi bacterium]|nr:hypothetical protein [Chloroflexota bacterium]
MEQAQEEQLFRTYIKQVAGLSSLTLSDERVEHMIPIVKEYFDNVQRLNVLNFDGVEPAAIFTMEPIKREES